MLAGKWLYIVGGYDPSGPNISPSIDALDTTLPADNGSNGGQIVHTNTPTNAIPRYGHAGITLSSTSLLIVGGHDDTTNFLTSMQKYTVDSSAGTVTSVTTAQNLATARMRFPLVGAVGAANKFLVFGGSTAMASGGDTASNSIELIDATGTLSASSFGTLQSARQGERVADLQSNLNSANSLFVIAGGASQTGGVEVVAGP